MNTYADVHHSAGTRPFTFLNIEYNAFAVAMGGASIAVPNGSNNIVSNPAGQGFNIKSLFFLSYCPIFDDIQGVSAGISHKLEKYGTIGVSLITLSSGDFAVTDELNGQYIETDEIARSNSFAGGISWAYKFTNYFSAGIALQGIYDNISIPEEQFTSSAVAVNIGVQYRFKRDRVVLGGVIKNFGYIVNQYNDIHYKMPIAIEYGISYVPSQLSNLRLAIDGSIRPGDFFMMRTGLELYVYKKVLALRLGMPFSVQDIRNVGNVDFTKSNSNILAVGVGINPSIRKVNSTFNFGLQLRTAGLPPSILVSNTTEF